MNIPIELFLGFIAISISLAIFGFIRNPQIPAMLAFAGIFIMFIAVTTDNIIMGKIPVESVVSGSTTSYTFEDNTFQFTEIPKTIFALIGVICMLCGGLMLRAGGG